MAVTCAYGKILPASLLDLPRFGFLNTHTSLLPKYRGLHTHRRALAAGDAEHGASLHFVDPELDAGAVLAQVRIPVLPGDTPDTLAQRLLAHEHRLMVAVLQLCVAGRVQERDALAHIDGHALFTPLRLDSGGLALPAAPDAQAPSPTP